MNNNDTFPVFDGQINALSIEDEPTESSAYRTPLSTNHVHYESQAFSVQLAVNSLVSAAAPLFHLATQLRHQLQPPDLDNLYKALCHEIHTFEYRAHSCDYPQQVIFGARYLICALLDEIILNTSWGKKSNWTQQSLLQTFQQESWGGERFFIILERCSLNPTHYIDLLELGYLCLSLGFKGKYQLAESSHPLEILIDNLYRLIRRQRGDFPRYLAIDTTTAISKKKGFWRLPPLWVTVILTILILSGIYIPYHHHVSQLSQTVYQALNETVKTATAAGQDYEKD